MIQLVVTSLFLGVGLAMDACAVSMANGMNEPKMRLRKVILIAVLFGLFQGAMPTIGYLIGAVILGKIKWIIPWVALVLLGIIGGKLLYEGIRHKEDTEESLAKTSTFTTLLVQAIATSIDALSVGFTIANYAVLEATIAVLIIAVVTSIICLCAVYIGKKFGTKLGNKAEILGGIILIFIGLEIFIQGIFF